MNHLRTSFSVAAATLAAFSLNPAPAAAQAVVFSQGVADLTFFYDSGADSFDVVFRSKSQTTATGLSSQYGPPPGGVGGVSGPPPADTDWNFTSLQTLVLGNQTIAIGGTDFFVTTASGNGYTRTNDPAQADLGFRTRFRDNALVDINLNSNGNQFADFRMTLNVSASTMPGEFALFRSIAGPVADMANILINTDADDFTTDLSNWGHTHYHWGFSEVGDYTLVFDIQGFNGTTAVTGADSFTLQFGVIPEPASFAAAFGAVALGFVMLRRRRQAEIDG